MFEHVSKPLLPRRQFHSRLVRAFVLGLGLIVVSLAIGMAGFMAFFATMDWAEAFVNAAMLLSGMGPLAVPQTTAAKVFAGCFALYSGLILLVAAGVIFAPVLHRFLHRMHADESADGR